MRDLSGVTSTGAGLDARQLIAKELLVTSTNVARIAILDDYQNVSLEMADWSPLAGRAVITVFNEHLSNLDEIVERLLPFDVICVMRERTPLSRAGIER